LADLIQRINRGGRRVAQAFNTVTNIGYAGAIIDNDFGLRESINASTFECFGGDKAF